MRESAEMEFRREIYKARYAEKLAKVTKRLETMGLTLPTFMTVGR